MKKKCSFLILFFGGLAGAFAQTAYELKTVSPAAVGYDAQKLAAIGKRANDSIPSLGSLLVWKKEGLIYQEYFHGADPNTVFDVKSVTKSITSAVTGLLSDRGLLPDLDTPVLDVLPEYDAKLSARPNIWYPLFIREQDSLRKLLTIKDLLTMRTGLLWDDNNPLIHRAFQCSSDPARFVLELSFESRPGTSFRYCTAGCQVLSAILEKSTKNNMAKYADSLLFKPLGMKIHDWPLDAPGRPSGGSALCTDAPSLVKFGLLYLNDGVVNGKQLLSKKWIGESTSAVAELNYWDVLPNANGYGYYWWRRKIKGHQAFVATGYGGQLICVIPDLEMVIVTTCFVNEHNRGRSEIRRLHGFIDQIVSAGMK